MKTYTIIHNNKRRTICLIEWGLAFSDGNGDVYINKNLESYNKELYDKILKHELEHDIGDYNSNDLEHDMEDIFPLVERIKFCMKYPKAFFYLSPVYITENNIAVSWLQMMWWFIIIGLLVFIGVIVL